jgi:hypothetical protein
MHHAVVLYVLATRIDAWCAAGEVAENPVFRELTFLTANTVMRHAAPFVSIARVREAEVHVGHAAILFVWNERHC